jgi:four helix bundle protein
MNNKTQELLDRTFNFGLDTLKMLNKLQYQPVYTVVINQLSRSATSIGANYEEAQAAVSKSDFTHKVSISLKEIRETAYWLRMLKELYSHENEIIKEIDGKLIEAVELMKIFTSIRLSSKK